MDFQNMCMGCMEIKPAGLNTCPYCGFNIITYSNKINNDEQSIIEINRRTMSTTSMPKELPQRPLPIGTMLGGSYMVGRRLGAGGFGVSYVGFDVDFERKVAIKEFYPKGYADRDVTGTNLVPRPGARGAYFTEQKEHFAHEGKVLAQVEEQGIVRVLSFCREFNTAYIIMEFLEGEDLAHYLNRRGGYLPVAEALEIMRPVVKSLALIHERGLVHRDISPDNIMLTKQGPKLIDFGAALGKGEHPEGPPIGKRGYAPSEQLKKGGVVGAHSDVYSLCATLYLLITGQKPPRSLDREKKDEIYNISDYGVEINRVQEAAIMQGLAMDYKLRIKNAGDLYYLLYVYGVKTESTVECLQKQVRESSTEVIMNKLERERKKSKTRLAYIIATICVLVLGCMIISVRAITKKLQESKKGTPVVITDDLGNTTDESDSHSVTEDDLHTYIDALYDAVDSDRQSAGYGALNKDKAYEAAANAGVAKCTQISAASQSEWSDELTEAALETMDENGITNAGWVIRAYSNDMTVEAIKEDIYAAIEDANKGIADAIDLMSCNKIGAATAISGDGTMFWMVIYR